MLSIVRERLRPHFADHSAYFGVLIRSPANVVLGRGGGNALALSDRNLFVDLAILPDPRRGSFRWSHEVIRFAGGSVHISIIAYFLGDASGFGANHSKSTEFAIA